MRMATLRFRTINPLAVSTPDTLLLGILNLLHNPMGPFNHLSNVR